MVNTNFAQHNFFQEPKVALTKELVYRCLIRLLTWNSIIMLLHSNAHAICHRWFNEALQKLTLLPKNLGICSSMDLMSFHADQSLSLFIYFLGKVFIIQFLSYINHTLLFLRNPIGKLTIEMITLLHSTNVTNLRLSILSQYWIGGRP